MAEKKIKLTVSQVLADMKGDAEKGIDGLDRKGLKEKYKLSHTDMKALFSHPALKGRKVKKEAGFELIDDVEGTEEGGAPSSNGAEAPTVAPQVEATEPATALDKW